MKRFIASRCARRRAKATASLLVAFALTGSITQAQYTLSDFNNTGFQYTFDDFSQSTGPTEVLLSDTGNGWGGAGNFGSHDLSGFADGRFVVGLTPHATNGVNRFSIELFDVFGKSGRWDMYLGGTLPDTPDTLVSPTTLSSPVGGNEPESLSLDRINKWQISGEFGSPGPFNISFDDVVVSNTTSGPPPYAGWEPDAPWRSVAEQRIDTHRKADLQVRVRDGAGNPVPGANVSVNMKAHEFGIGSAVRTEFLRDNAAEHDTYKQKVEQLFNEAVFENNMKWPAWEGEWGDRFTQQGALDAATWLQSKDIALRGHTLVWPNAIRAPQSIQNLLAGAPLDASQQQQLRDAISAHISDIAGVFDGIVSDWDVLNEPRANHQYMDVLSEGNHAIIDWLNAAAAASPGTNRYVNEYNILSSAGGTNTTQQQHLEDIIDYARDQGTPFEGIGFQAHFKDDNLTGPVALWSILDRFEEEGLDMKVTEFSFETLDEQLQADFTRDFLTAIYAHEGIDSMLLWGFWEDAIFSESAALYRSDWTAKPNGQILEDLVFNEWWTDEDEAADSNGEASVRGFKGEYEVTVEFDGKSVVLPAKLTDEGLVVDAVLTTHLSGDYNRDGRVDAADYSLWRDSLGQSVTSGSGADGDGNGIVDQQDYLVWQGTYGATLQNNAIEVAEPAAFGGSLIAWLLTDLLFSLRSNR